MASDSASTTPPAPTPAETSAAFARMIADGVSQGIAATQAKRKVTLGEYDPKTVFHPDRTKAKHFTEGRSYYQNGNLMFEHNLFDTEIELLNAITHSGRYIDRLIDVRVVPTTADESEVYLSYSNKTADQKLEHKGKYRSLGDMLEQIVREQAVERAEDASIVARGSKRR